MLDRSAVSYQIVLTKRDEVKLGEQEARIAAVEAALAKRPAAFPAVLFTSARTGEGIAELRAAIARLLHERSELRGEPRRAIRRPTLFSPRRPATRPQQNWKDP